MQNPGNVRAIHAFGENVAVVVYKRHQAAVFHWHWFLKILISFKTNYLKFASGDLILKIFYQILMILNIAKNTFHSTWIGRVGVWKCLEDTSLLPLH